LAGAAGGSAIRRLSVFTVRPSVEAWTSGEGFDEAAVYSKSD
jgi:hypothetical protein